MTLRQRKRRIKQLAYIVAIYADGVMDLYDRCPCSVCRAYRGSRRILKRVGGRPC